MLTITTKIRGAWLLRRCQRTPNNRLRSLWCRPLGSLPRKPASHHFNCPTHAPRCQQHSGKSRFLRTTAVQSMGDHRSETRRKNPVPQEVDPWIMKSVGEMESAVAEVETILQTDVEIEDRFEEGGDEDPLGPTDFNMDVQADLRFDESQSQSWDLRRYEHWESKLRQACRARSVHVSLRLIRVSSRSLQSTCFGC